jgi:hypothetical protein
MMPMMLALATLTNVATAVSSGIASVIKYMIRISRIAPTRISRIAPTQKKVGKKTQVRVISWTHPNTHKYSRENRPQHSTYTTDAQHELTDGGMRGYPDCGAARAPHAPRRQAI